MYRFSVLFFSLLLAIGLMGFFSRATATAINASGSVVVSEVAWSGTNASTSDEWIELYNPTNAPINLTNWTLQAQDGTPSITLQGSIAANSFFLLERTNESTVSDLTADQLYSGSLENVGETLFLRDESDGLIDTVNGSGGTWSSGSSTSPIASMERIDPALPDAENNWETHDGNIRNGLDANGEPINGTPGQPNSAWAASGADLAITKWADAPVPGATVITYHIVLENIGDSSAENIQITDTLPAALAYISQTSNVTFTHPNATVLAWSLAQLAPQTSLTIELNTQIATDTQGAIVNSVTVSSQTTETVTSNNTASATTLIGSVILINALHYDAYHAGDEAIQLVNLSNRAVDLTGWRFSDGGVSAELPTTVLSATRSIWIADDRDRFYEQFGFYPTLSEVDLNGSWPGFANNGDEVFLYNAGNLLIDTLVYNEGATTALGWDGVAVTPYNKGSLGSNGQILYRQRDEGSGLPVLDTNSAEDWANSAENIHSGRKARFPGWDLDTFFQTASFTETSQITISVSPDNSHATVKQLIESAQTSIQLEIFSITNLSLAQALFAAAERGVAVDILLEGAPPGGLIDQTRYICQQLEAAGGNCWFSISEVDQDIYDRYRFIHAKFMIVDDERVMISSDNFSGSSMPYDAFTDGTSGRRGVQITTDAPSAVAHLQTVWQKDFDLANHRDIFAWSADDPLYGNTYGRPVSDFIPDDISGGFTYTVRYPNTITLSDTFAYEIVQSPENSLRSSDGLIGLINRAGAGDTLYVQQLDERPHWGNTVHTVTTDPNPRLHAYIEAARRGAHVWIMLDSYIATKYYDPTDKPDNADVCSYAATVAAQENLNLRCQLSNPTDLGIHNKMVLAQIDGDGFIHVGSINGTEQSSKGNREIAIQIQSNEAYDFLSEVFLGDWTHRSYVPFMMRQLCGETNRPLISEVFYNPVGTSDESEFVEIVNPTCSAVNLSGYSIGDAVHVGEFEDVRHFPEGTILEPLETIVIAYKATAFMAQFGRNPDYELLDSDPTVINLIDDPLWDSAATFRLGNSGDEVLLRDQHANVIDVVTYGSGVYPNVIAAPATSGSDRSLERIPFWQDTNNGVNDMRDVQPSPGEAKK
ncbi:MAG: lamin tail domain-containing protein [Candidatus Promineifilaceae bacterium]